MSCCLTFGFGVELAAEEDGDPGEVQPEDQDGDAGEGTIGLTVVAEPGDVEGETYRGGKEDD